MVSQDDFNLYSHFPHEVEFCFCLLAIHIFFQYDFPIDIFPHTSIIFLDFLLIYKRLLKKSEYKI